MQILLKVLVIEATVAGFKAHGYGTEEALDLVKLSVRLAVQARNEFLEAKANDALTLRGITLGEQLPDGSVRYFSEGALPNHWLPPLSDLMVLSWRMDRNIVATTVYKPNI